MSNKLLCLLQHNLNKRLTCTLSVLVTDRRGVQFFTAESRSAVNMNPMGHARGTGGTNPQLTCGWRRCGSNPSVKNAFSVDREDSRPVQGCFTEGKHHSGTFTDPRKRASFRKANLRCTLPGPVAPVPWTLNKYRFTESQDMRVTSGQVPWSPRSGCV